MTYPPDEDTAVQWYGWDWRLVYIESWTAQPFWLKVYHTVTRRHVFRMIRKVELA